MASTLREPELKTPARQREDIAFGDILYEAK